MIRHGFEPRGFAGKSRTPLLTSEGGPTVVQHWETDRTALAAATARQSGRYALWLAVNSSFRRQTRSRFHRLPMTKTNVAGNQATHSTENTTSSTADQLEDDPTGGDKDVADELSLDVVFDVLKNSRRRLVLEYLAKQDDTVDLRDLADYVTAAENDTEVSAITSKERKRVYVGLYQFHLPKMDDMGIIDFNQDRGRIQLTERGQTLVRKHTEHTTSGGQAAPYYYSMAGIGGTGAALAIVIGSLPLAVALLAMQSLLLALVTAFQPPSVSIPGGDRLSTGNES